VDLAHAQFVDNDTKLEVTVTFDYSPLEASLSLSQSSFVKTKKDGFELKATSQYAGKVIGTAYLSWQAKGLYEIVLYTDNVADIGPIIADAFNWDVPNLFETITDKKTRVAKKSTYIESFTGIHPITWNTSHFIPGFTTVCLPVKVWLLKTAGVLASGEPQETAPVEPDGSIRDIYFRQLYTWRTNPVTGVLERVVTNEDTLSFYVIPERLAVDSIVALDPSVPASDEYGSYKKVIASTVDASDPKNYELTLAMDLYQGTTTEPTQLKTNFTNGYKKYVGKIYIDLIGN
jgi:hypothetical protein